MSAASGRPDADLLQARIAFNVRLARTRRGLSQRQLARLLDIDPIQVSRWERGLNTPSTTSIIALAGVTDVDPGWFYADHANDSVALTA
jgi:transcriptional regulator with XRE-family HTH domain